MGAAKCKNVTVSVVAVDHTRVMKKVGPRRFSKWLQRKEREELEKRP
jgi:hypothetical protein